MASWQAECQVCHTPAAKPPGGDSSGRRRPSPAWPREIPWNTKYVVSAPARRQAPDGRVFNLS
ncbi:MAG TPA: hypothetical protein VNO70_24005 [Blastocatellia bacterium]|nr:hypothetical protein [Blastocatellia bacterium]